MDDLESSFQREALPIIRDFALWKFRGDWDDLGKACDAIAVAWEMWRVDPNRATPLQIARYAVRRVNSRRRFRESVRSITTPSKAGEEKPERIILEVEWVCDYSSDPAELAALKIDFADWLETLSPLQRSLVERLAVGERSGELALEFGCSQSALCNRRKWLLLNWLDFRD